MFDRIWGWVKRVFKKPSEPVKTPSQPKIDNGDFTPSQYQEHYQQLWDTMVIKPEKMPTVNWYIKKIKEGEARYKEVEAETKVPWQVIGAKHLLEGAGDFKRVLHNGESLSSVNRYGTRLVPKGRGKGLNWDWEDAAIDALRIKKQPMEWSIVNTLHYAERFNGLSYLWNRSGKMPHSPYLWSFSNHYTKGKFVRDHVYDDSAVSKQCGLAVILKVMGYIPDQ